MKLRLEERFDKYYNSLNEEANNLQESVKNIYKFTVIEKNDDSYSDTVEAYSYSQAKLLAHKEHKGCLIRDIHPITNNEDNSEYDDDVNQLSLFR